MISFREYLREKECGKNEEIDYKTFFAQKLKKYGVNEPDELSDEDKKKFFDEIDAEWEGEKEEIEETELDEAKKIIVNKQQLEWFIDLVKEADTIDSLLGDLKLMKNMVK
jgi:hypothetical protein